MIENTRTILADENGATMVEYALLLSLISAAAIALLSPIGEKVFALFKCLLDNLS